MGINVHRGTETYMYTWASIPSEAIMHFPLVLDFPHGFRKISFSNSVENIIFSQTNFRFSSAKIYDDLFKLLTTNFEFPLIFAISIHFFPISGNFSFPVPFQIFPHPFLVKFTCFFTYFVFFVSPLVPYLLTMMHLCITQGTYWTPLQRTETNTEGQRRIY